MAEGNGQHGDDSASVTLEVRNGAAWITLNRPDAGNPLGTDCLDRLADAVVGARRADVGVVVLRARGPRFSVGGDLSEFGAAQDPEALVDNLAERLHRTVSELIRLDAIVVAAVHGVAAGAGVSLAAAADIVLAAESARFTLAYTRSGLSPDGGSSMLTASLGLHRALYVALLNPLLSANEAKAMGLVAEVHPDEGFEEAVEETVGRLTRGSRSAFVTAKRLFREQAVAAPETAMRRETLGIRSAAGGPDGREGIAAFLAKRTPMFPSSLRGPVAGGNEERP